MNIPNNQGLRCIAEITAPAVGNSRDVYRSVVGQFPLTTHERWRALFNDDGTLKATWCNIALWDISSAFGCEIPHWVKKGTTDEKGKPKFEACDQLPTEPLWGPGAVDRVELSANDTVRWLSTTGVRRFGWKLVTRAGAYDSVNGGAFTIAVMLNPMGHGHVAVCLPLKGAVILPLPPNTADKNIPIQIAQAGADNFFDLPLEHGFGRNPVTFYSRAA